MFRRHNKLEETFQNDKIVKVKNMSATVLECSQSSQRELDAEVSDKWRCIGTSRIQGGSARSDGVPFLVTHQYSSVNPYVPYQTSQVPPGSGETSSFTRSEAEKHA
jgi:hypothetical protein